MPLEIRDALADLADLGQQPSASEASAARHVPDERNTPARAQQHRQQWIKSWATSEAVACPDAAHRSSRLGIGMERSTRDGC
jgi:hypothetical protein